MSLSSTFSQGLSYTFVLNISLVNLNNLRNKLHHVNSYLIENEVHIFAICETWLISSIADSFVRLDNYNTARSDNPGSTKKHGVALYVHSSIKFHIVDILLNIITIYLVEFDI